VTNWLDSHRFQIAGVSAGKTVIEFSGSAGQVRNAFHTEIHRYVVNGQEHLANASDPQIPTALAQVVAGPVSLHNFPKKALNHTAGVFRKAKTTGQVTPLFTFNSGPFCGTRPCNALGPGDFDKIYSLFPKQRRSLRGANNWPGGRRGLP
jgi:subtilase family serine protease